MIQVILVTGHHNAGGWVERAMVVAGYRGLRAAHPRVFQTTRSIYTRGTIRTGVGLLSTGVVGLGVMVISFSTFSSLAPFLHSRSWPAMCIHGDKSQPERDWVLNGKNRCLSMLVHVSV